MTNFKDLDFDLDNCLRFVNNKYELVLLAKNRAMDILSGNSQPIVQKSAHEKSFFTALKEIDSGEHNYESLNDQFLLSIKNEVAGVLIQTEDISPKEKDKFDEDSLFAQIFQNMGANNESSKDDVFENMIESSDELVSLEDSDEDEVFSNIESDLDDEEI